MKQLSTIFRGLMVLCLMQPLFISVGNGQTLTTKANTYIDANANGYIEYLPAGYNTSQKYPLIMAYHGSGEIGDGSAGSLTSVANNGLPGIIKNGKFPSSVTVNGNTYQFIVIAPQFRSNPDSATMEDVYQYCLSHYSVDVNRVYMTGYSQGGGNTAYYTGTRRDRAAKIAAIVTIAVSVDLSPDWAQNIASANLPMLATANSGDTWYASNTIDNVTKVNGSNPAPGTPAADYLFNASGHGGWNETYDPTVFTYNGLNVYQWMLQFSRSLAALPVVLGSYTAQQTGAYAVTVNWNTTNEINNKYFILQHSSDGIAFSAIDTTAAANLATGAVYSYTDTHASAGNNFYRLVQVDIDGKTTYFDVLKVIIGNTPQSGLRISPNPAAGMVQLQLSSPETGDVQVSLLDMQGRTLRNWKFNKGTAIWQQTLQLGNIVSGNYTIQVRGTTIHEVLQFVKQ